MNTQPSSATQSPIIPYGKQHLDADDIQAVVDVLKSDWLTQGPAVTRFESALADYCQVPYAVAFSSATAALHTAVAVAGLGAGGIGLTSPLTFVATANALLYNDATPGFMDIDPMTLNLDARLLPDEPDEDVKAILPVHFAGLPCDLPTIYAWAKQRNIVVIEDAAHALGAFYTHPEWGRVPVGKCQDMAVFSFHPVKPVTTGEGGAIVTPHQHYYEKLVEFRSHGITRDPARMFWTDSNNPDPWHYEMQSLGYNYRMCDIQAALGWSQLSKLDSFRDRRDVLVKRYQEAFGRHPALCTQRHSPDLQSGHHLFPIWLNTANTSITRRGLYDHLVAQGIRPQVHYRPVHLQPYYQQHCGTKAGMFPEAETYAENCLSLPLYVDLTDAQQARVIEAVLSAL